MFVGCLARMRLPLCLGFLLVALALLGSLSAPEAPGRAPAPPKKKDKYDEAVERGLEWLALHQAADGHWSLNEFNKHAREKPLPEGKIVPCNCEAGTANRNDIAATAFGLLPFLAAGHGSQKSSKKPDYSKSVDTGLKYLIGKQAKNGSFGTNDMYSHGLAARALCDAYALTKDDKLKEPAQKALDFIVDAQDPVGGGWRYAPRQAGDLSVTGWQFSALKRGQTAKLKVPKKTLQLVESFVDACESAGTGGYAYVPGQAETLSMTAVGLLCRQYSGVGPRNAGLLNGVQKIKESPPDQNDNIYYLYYATQVMHHMQGETWKFWSLGPDGIGDTRLAKQDKGDTAGHPHQQGSWSGSQGGRIMATSLSLLILQQRHQQPLYRREK
jgi:hypothetical protein